VSAFGDPAFERFNLGVLQLGAGRHLDGAAIANRLHEPACFQVSGHHDAGSMERSALGKPDASHLDFLAMAAAALP